MISLIAVAVVVSEYEAPAEVEAVEVGTEDGTYHSDWEEEDNNEDKDDEYGSTGEQC